MRTKKNSIFLMGLIFGLGSYLTAQADEGIPLRGFSDVSYIYDHSDNSNSFRIGDVDFFLAKPIDKKVNILIELNFQPSFHSIGADLERTYVQYTFNQWLKVAAGRVHTGLGYWNETFHHGTYLYTSVTRPIMERFEDDEGLLPTHTTGLEFRGNGLVGSGNLGYIVDIGNSRGPKKDPPAWYYSYTKSKSTSFVLYYEFPAGLRIGTSVYRSDLPGANAKDDDGTPLAGGQGNKGSEWIYGGHLVYNSPEIEFMNEFALIKHTYADAVNPDGSSATSIKAFYSQFGYHLGQFTPYARFEVNATDHPDSYLDSLISTVHYYTAGVRYELSSASALKFENFYKKVSASDFAPGSNAWSSMVNWSFGW